MAYFSYKARSPNGNTVTGLVEAPNSAAASKLLHDKQLFIINLSEKKNQFFFDSTVNRFKKVRFSDIVNFTRQLSTMVTAGLSLPEALSILRAQMKNPSLGQMLLDVEHHIVGGGNLADALAKYPQYFAPIYTSLVRAGEQSGTLDQVLARLAETLESQREFKSKVTGALVYPVIILIGMLAVIVVMMTVVIPKLTDLYDDFDIALPITTQILIGISQFTLRFWWIVLLAAVGVGLAFNRWRKTEAGTLVIDSLILRLPLIGELQKKVILVEFTRTMAMLIGAGIHILDGLNTLRDSLGNVLFRNAIGEIAKKVEKGFSLGESFGQYEVFPAIVSQMMKIGEETGKLDETLSKLSKYFQTESEHLIKGLTTAIEPIIMVVLGVGVGFIVISIITPIYSLTAQFK